MEVEHFPMCQRHGLGNIVWSPLEGGWLSGKYQRGAVAAGETPRLAWIGDPENPKFQRRRHVVEALLPIAAAHGVSLAR
ncbi:aldo/keto reductase, partial [Klebsiella pneumoniae]|nr:aldo/keto reductase [Klebsiella pneumoniae]